MNRRDFFKHAGLGAAAASAAPQIANAPPEPPVARGVRTELTADEYRRLAQHPIKWAVPNHKTVRCRHTVFCGDKTHTWESTMPNWNYIPNRPETP